MKKELEVAIANIRKQYGQTAVMPLGTAERMEVETIPSGSLAVDVALGTGGFPRGRVVEIFGPECVDANTYLQFNVRHSGCRRNTKGGTIERLYERFHGASVHVDRRGRNNRRMVRQAEFTCPAMAENGRVVHHRIAGVISSGQKECFELVTEGGNRIVATKEHHFFTGSEYKKLGSFLVGDTVFVHRGIPFRGRQKEQKRAFLYVKAHAVAGTKVVVDKARGYKNAYCRLRRNRAVVEARMNGLSFSDYVSRLNSGNISGLVFLPRHVHIHHRDENPLNDNEGNLQNISPSDHGKLHANQRRDNLSFVVVPDKIKSISPAGLRQTYDVVMEEPYRNFIGDGFVAHNSGGKTTLALHIIANAQRLGGVSAFVDAEHALDPTYARALGVDVDNLLISQPDNGEQALEIADALIASGGVAVVVVDSVAALVPKAELEGMMGEAQMGLQARLMSQALRKLTASVARTKTCLVFINQIRDKIGVMFGSPETTTGGRALKFYASIRVDIRRTQTVKTGDIKTGNETRVKVVKNKLAAPFREAEIEIVFGEGISNERDLLVLGVEHGLVEKAGAWYSYGRHRLGQGTDGACKTLKEHPEAARSLEAELRAKLFPKGPYDRKSHAAGDRQGGGGVPLERTEL